MPKKLDICEAVIQMSIISALGLNPSGDVRQKNPEQMQQTGERVEALLTEVRKEVVATQRDAELQAIIPPENLPERLEFTGVDGDPEIGTVIQIRQVHSHPLSVNRESDGNKIAVAYQRRVLEELIVMKPKVLIAEGNQYSKESENKPSTSLPEPDFFKPYYGSPPELLESIEFAYKVLKNGPDSLNGDKAKRLDEKLFGGGADFLYEMGAPGITMIPSGCADTVEDVLRLEHQRLDVATEIVDLIAKGTELSAEDEKRLTARRAEKKEIGKKIEALQALREKELVKQVMKYLKDHPGQTIVTTYGAAHNFCDDFRALKRPPVFKTVIFPRLLLEMKMKDLMRDLQPCVPKIQESD